MKPSLFVKSCHASLEYDQARMFTDLGYKVGGNWDIGSKQRPKIPGVTDYNADLNDFDLIILHQIPNYVQFMKDLLDKGKRVVIVSFGQTDTWQYKAMGELCRVYPHAYVAAYSKKDYRIHLEHHCPLNKLRLLYFGKYLSDYQPWTGEDPVCYLTCNSFHKRGHGCGWHVFEKIKDQIPVVFSGKDTQEVGGLGEIPETEMREHLRKSACFLSFGTIPAALVMTQMEAWCAGCPTVCYNNGSGLAEEKMSLILETSPQNIVRHVKRLISNTNYREIWHRHSVENAKRFDVKDVGQRWADYIREICK